MACPIEEMREVVHRFVFPIKFGGDHTIWKKVHRIRQALSLDDERLTFHPIRVSLKSDEPDLRIQEVWFAGVHSDVGGGYPDDMTAHCPLVWMIRELETAATDRALTFHETALAEFRRTATPFGPLHNSRAGVAVLYRYDPRQVTLTDPAGNPYYRPTVHHTVVERLWTEAAITRRWRLARRARIKPKPGLRAPTSSCPTAPSRAPRLDRITPSFDKRTRRLSPQTYAAMAANSTLPGEQ